MHAPVPLGIITQRQSRKIDSAQRSMQSPLSSVIHQVSISPVISPFTPRKLILNSSSLKQHIPVPLYNTSNRAVARGVVITQQAVYGPGGQIGVRGLGIGGLCAACPPGAANDAFGAIASIITSQIDLVSISKKIDSFFIILLFFLLLKLKEWHSNHCIYFKSSINNR